MMDKRVRSKDGILLRVENQSDERNLSQCHLVYHKSHMTCKMEMQYFLCEVGSKVLCSLDSISSSVLS
jgi:hypothetical protein